MEARSVLFATANSTILDHILPFAPKHANGSIGTAYGAKLHCRIEAIVAIGHFAVGGLKSY